MICGWVNLYMWNLQIQRANCMWICFKNGRSYFYGNRKLFLFRNIFIISFCSTFWRIEIIYIVKNFLLPAHLFLKRMIKWFPLLFRTRENFIKMKAEFHSAEPSRKRKLRALKLSWCCYCHSREENWGQRKCRRIDKA